MNDQTCHILPVNDIYEHHESLRCSCRPKVKFSDKSELIIIHRAFDRRELFESDYDLTINEWLEKITLLPKFLWKKVRSNYIKWKLNQIFKKPGATL